MARRLALLVATWQYADTGLRRLTSPARDAEALAAVLGDPAIAGFEVTTLVNQPHHTVGEAIAELYRDRRRDDLTLLYFSGHGLKDDDGRLYLAMADTRRDSLLFTALPAEHLDRAMEGCASRQKVLILDCCYSGAFPTGPSKGDTEVHTLERFQGRGRTVLTASDATQYSFDGDQPHGEASRSVFTRHLVAGLRDGSADLDGDGDITLDELYAYVHDHVVEDNPHQRPKKQDDVQGRTIIARNINWTLPGYLHHAIRSPIAQERLVAVDGLAHLYQVGNATVRDRARLELQQLTEDDSRLVSAAATQQLRTTTTTEPPPPEPPAPKPPALERPASERAAPERASVEWGAPEEPAPQRPASPPAPAWRPPVVGAVPRPGRRRGYRLMAVVAAAIVVVVGAVTTTVVLLNQGGDHSGAAKSGGTAYPVTAPGLAVSPDGRWLYAAVNQLGTGGGRGASVMVALDVKARVARGQMEFGPGAGQAVISPDGQELYITQLSSDYAVHILRLGPQPVGIGEVQFTASAGPDSEGNRSLALSRDGSHLYFADERTSTVSVGDTHATWGHPSAQVIQVTGGARHLVLSPDGKRLYIIGQFLSWLDTATGKLTNGSALVGGDTRAVAISPDGRHLYVADHRWSFVNVIDLQANKITDSIRPGCGTGPVSIALSRDGSRLYTACESSSVVSTNDTTTGSAVGQPVTVGSRPSTMALSPDGGRLYVATVNGRNIEIATVDTAAGTAVQPPITVASWLASPSPSATSSPTT